MFLGIFQSRRPFMIFVYTVEYFNIFSFNNEELNGASITCLKYDDFAELLKQKVTAPKVSTPLGAFCFY